MPYWHYPATTGWAGGIGNESSTSTALRITRR
jgi:hypothetical protein